MNTDGHRFAAYCQDRGINDTVHPLTPALSPSEGEREQPRQLWEVAADVSPLKHPPQYCRADSITRKVNAFAGVCISVYRWLSVVSSLQLPFLGLTDLPLAGGLAPGRLGVNGPFKYETKT